jgi:hypothetical protein
MYPISYVQQQNEEISNNKGFNSVAVNLSETLSSHRQQSILVNLSAIAKSLDINIIADV